MWYVIIAMRRHYAAGRGASGTPRMVPRGMIRICTVQTLSCTAHILSCTVQHTCMQRSSLGPVRTPGRPNDSRVQPGVIWQPSGPIFHDTWSQHASCGGSRPSPFVRYRRSVLGHNLPKLRVRGANTELHGTNTEFNVTNTELYGTHT